MPGIGKMFAAKTAAAKRKRAMKAKLIKSAIVKKMMVAGAMKQAKARAAARAFQRKQILGKGFW